MSDDDARARFDKLRAAKEAEARQAAVTAAKARADADAFVGRMNALLAPLLRAKAEALHRTDDPVTMIDNGFLYRDLAFTCWIMPAFSPQQVIGGPVRSHEEHQVRGDYLRFATTRFDRDPQGNIVHRTVIRDSLLYEQSPEEPRWAHMTLEESVSYGAPYEGSIPETRRRSFVPKTIKQTTEKLMQAQIEHMIGEAR